MNYIPNTLFLGKKIIVLDTVDSTNKYAIELLAKNKPIEGTAILAYHQHSGRGQFGNSWDVRGQENLTFSTILFPKFLSVNKQFYLSKIVALSIFNVLETLGFENVSIKWPNDIFIKDKKVSGVLIESSIVRSNLGYSVIGIGLNVNQTEFNNLPRATSLKLEAKKEFLVEEIYIRIIEELEPLYLELKRGDFSKINRNYLRNLYKYQELHEFFIVKNSFIGQILGVTDEGFIQIESDGKINQFGFKEVAFFEE